MDRNKELAEQYKKIVDSKAAQAIPENQKALFERLIDNEMTYLNEATFSGDMARLGQILIPVYRRAFPQLIGKDIVGVQPLKQPTGYAFALRYSYSGNSSQASGLTGGVEKFVGGQATKAGGKADGHLSGSWNFTPQDTTRSAVTSLLVIYASTAARTSDAGTVAANATSYGALPTGSEVLAADSGAQVIYTEENKALISVTTANIAAIQALGVTTGNDISEVVDNEVAYLTILKNYSGPVATLAGEQLGMDISELGLSIEKIAIEAQTRKLKARYTIEAAQDLKAAHGKDMAAELIDILTFEITQAIDRQIIDTINGAAVASSFDLGTVGSVNGSADGRWQLEKFRTAYTEIIRKSNDIARTTLRGPGNFIICHPDVATMMEQMPGFTGIAPVAGTVNTNTPVNQTGTALIGTLGGRFNVYLDIFANNKTATIGYKGASSYDAGVIWSPYIPISMKQTTDQESANPNIIFMERSAISENIYSSDLYYRIITFNNLF